MVRRSVLAAACFVFVGSGLAFQWEPFVFPEGDQRYVLELRSSSEGGEAQVSTIAIDISEEGGQYTVATTYALEQRGLDLSELGDAALGGSMMGTLAFGPMMMFGPSFMMLPMMLGQEDIAVRSEPMLVMGMGRLYMDRSETVAGHECVVLRFEPNDGEPFEFALAEGLPFPCYSRFDTGDGFTEVRLVSVE